MKENKLKTTNVVVRFFKLLINAVSSCWDQLWKSFVILVILTVILATIFYFYEAPLQEEYANWWKDLRWAFFSYIGDPGGFGGEGPVTFGGRVIATLLSIVNILIFAVPAGIIASGLTTALEEDSKEKKMQKNLDKIRSSFKPAQCKHTFMRVVPAYKSIASIQVKHGLSENEIIEAVGFKDDDDLRLRNLADTFNKDANAMDRLVVERFPMIGGKKYGNYINRHSNVTIVSPSCHLPSEIGSSRFGYLLAKLGGFNFISRDIDEADFSYYLVPKGAKFQNDEVVADEKVVSEPFKQFFKDLKKLAPGENHWVIFILQFDRQLKSQISFITNTKPDEGLPESTVIQTSTFEQTYQQIKTVIENHKYQKNEAEVDFYQTHPLSVDHNTCFRPAGPRNIGIKIGGGVTTNALTLRISADLVVRDRRDVTIALTLAEIMRKNFCGTNSDDKYVEERMKQWMDTGIDYDYQEDKKTDQTDR